MKTLYLLRHAKSAWDDDGLEDHARPLNARGRQSAPGMGKWIAAQGFLPGLVLCSTALRARETVALAFPEPLPVPLQFDKRIYLAKPGALMALLQDLSEPLASVLLVGHNPGLADLALLLTRADGPPQEEKRRRALATKLPTTGFVALELPVERWRNVAPESARLVQFMIPREL